MRLFPFDTSASGNSGVTNTDMYVRNYGKGLKSTATFTAAIAAEATFNKDHSLRGTKGLKFALADADNKDQKPDSTLSKTGYIVMKYAATKWGGTCCAKYADGCKDWGPKATTKAGTVNDGKTDGSGNWEDGFNAASKLRGRCDAVSGNLKLFATANQAKMAHCFYNDYSSGTVLYNALTTLAFSKIMTMPAHLTTLRGRGGFGTSAQALADVFFQLTSSHSDGRGIQTLMRFYVSNASPTTDKNMLVTAGYPMNTYALDNKVDPDQA